MSLHEKINQGEKRRLQVFNNLRQLCERVKEYDYLHTISELKFVKWYAGMYLVYDHLRRPTIVICEDNRVENLVVVRTHKGLKFANAERIGTEKAAAILSLYIAKFS
jgi:hypothetical protein